MLLDHYLLLIFLRVFCILIGVFLLLRVKYYAHEIKGFEAHVKLYSFIGGIMLLYVGVRLPEYIPFVGNVPFFEHDSEKLAALLCIGSLFDLFHPPLQIKPKALATFLSLTNRITFVFTVIVLVIGFL